MPEFSLSKRLSNLTFFMGTTLNGLKVGQSGMISARDPEGRLVSKFPFCASVNLAGLGSFCSLGMSTLFVSTLFVILLSSTLIFFVEDT